MYLVDGDYTEYRKFMESGTVDDFVRLIKDKKNKVVNSTESNTKPRHSR